MSRVLLVALGLVLGATAVIAESGRNRSLSESFTKLVRAPGGSVLRWGDGDPVAQLKRRIDSGEVRLHADAPSGYLRSVLDALHVPIESQIVVFNPDSVQASSIWTDI